MNVHKDALRKARFVDTTGDRIHVPAVTRQIHLARVMNRDLQTPAPPRITKLLGLPEGANFAEAICRCAILQAATGDTKAAAFVHDVVEKSQQKSPLVNILIGSDKLEAAIEAARQNPFQLTGDVIDA